MDERLAFTHSGSDRRVSMRGIAFSERSISCWNPASGDSTRSLAVDHGHEPEGRSAQSHRLVEHRIEYRSEVAGRSIDDLQDLGSRGLLFERLARFTDEPRVLHRDDRLRCKVLQHRDLLV